MDYVYPTYEIERFTRDTAKHGLTVLRDDGLYRHLRCKQPGSGFCWFDVVTWPGYLTVVGDFGDGLTFARIEDMLQFFRAKAGWNMGRINPDYWAQKIVSGRDGVQKHSGVAFRHQVDEHVKNAVEFDPSLAYSDNDYQGLPAAVDEALTDEYDPDYAETARGFLDQFTYSYLDRDDDGAPLSGQPKTFRFEDTWEWDFTDWDWSYLWACHAIQWAVDAYDKTKVDSPVAEAVSV